MQKLPHTRSRRGSPLLLLLVAVALLATPLVAPQSTGAQASPPPGSARLADDLRMLALGGTPQSVNGLVADSRNHMQIDTPSNRVIVRVTARDVTALQPQLQQLGFVVAAASPDHHLIEGSMPIDRLTDLPQLASAGLLGVTPVYTPLSDKGSVTSQADFVHDVDRARATLPASLDGSGFRIGILSDSYDALGGASAGIASGDLPAAGVTVLEDGSSLNLIDEGRAMAELIHDLAPGAALSFATAFGGEANFAANIRRLADPAEGDCDVLVDDIVYLSEPFFQDGIVAQAVDDVVVNRGVPYFTSAGNRGTRAYESTNFNATTATIAGGTVQAHDFDPGSGTDTLQRVTVPARASTTLVLQWSDPFYTIGGVDTNLDFYMLAPNGDVIAADTTNNVLVQQPLATIQVRNNGFIPTEVDLAITLNGGPAPERIKYVNFNSALTDIEFATNSPTVNPHAAAVNAQGVAAVNYYQQDTIASFSARGPSTFLFESDGTPKASPEVRQTPAYAAAQGTDTTFFGESGTGDVEGNGFPNFFGTSAAAPHAAAIATLVKQRNPDFTPQQIYDQLASTATDIDEVGFDNSAGAGLLNAYAALFGDLSPTLIPYSESFESGVLSNAWTRQSTVAGRSFLSGEFEPPNGSQHLLMSATLSTTTTSRNEATLHVNPLGADDITLSFQYRGFDDELQELPATFTGSQDGDGVSLSVDGTTWYRLIEIDDPATNESYQSATVDISTFLNDRSLTVTDILRIKFQQTDNFAIDAQTGRDGFGYDDIRLTAATIDREQVFLPMTLR